MFQFIFCFKEITALDCSCEQAEPIGIHGKALAGSGFS